MNKIILVGNVAHEPEQLKGQVLRVKVSLAVDRGAAKADFIPVIIWDKLAQICLQYFFKGIRLLVEGRLRIGSYQKRQVVEVVAQHIEFLSRKKIEPPPEPKIKGNRKRAKAKAIRLRGRERR